MRKFPLDIAVRELAVETGTDGSFLCRSRCGQSAESIAEQLRSGWHHRFSGHGGADSLAGGTGAQYQDEITAGAEHEFTHNLTLTGRFVYRDLRRIIEDTSGINITQALAGVPQLYVIGNPSLAWTSFQNRFPVNRGTRELHRIQATRPLTTERKIRLGFRRHPGRFPESVPHL